MKKILTHVTFLVCLLSVNISFAFDVVVEFSAEAVQSMPTRPDYRARMYVSKKSVRTDSIINKTPVIEIVNTKKGIKWLLIPKEKVYVQYIREHPPESTGSVQSDNETPCARLVDTTCKMLSMEMINKRPTEKWEFVQKKNGQIYQSLHWIDKQRRMPVREYLPDGTVTEVLLHGIEKVDGRNTEKWVMQVTHANGQTMASTQWYDPELKISIREEMPGGYVRELREIKTGKQDKNLFEIPEGYKKTEKLPAYLMPQQANAPGY